MFASRTKKTVTVGDVSITIRKLSARNLEDAAITRTEQIARNAKSWGADLMKVFRSEEVVAAEKVRAEKRAAEEKAEPTDEQKRAARYSGYDRSTVLAYGIVSWSEAVDVKKGLEDLDEEVSEFLFKEILDLSLPTLDKKAAEEKAGNV